MYIDNLTYNTKHTYLTEIFSHAVTRSIRNKANRRCRNRKIVRIWQSKHLILIEYVIIDITKKFNHRFKEQRLLATSYSEIRQRSTWNDLHKW